MFLKIFISVMTFVFAVACTGCKEKETPMSMEKIYAEEGRPVETRRIEKTDFSVFYKFPADYKSRSQSTAYAKLPDVVRKVNVKVGDKVRRDDIIVSLSDDNANYQQAKLQVENAETSFRRMESLYKQSGVSKQDYDNARTQLNVAKESLRSIEEMIHIKAPISGTVTQINVQVSSNVGPQTPLFTISNTNGYEASFYVLPNEIQDIKEGARAFIETREETLPGRIEEVSMTMDGMLRAFPVKAYFDKTSKFLVSGMHVDVTVEAYSNPDAVVLSQAEMTRSGDEWSAYVVKDGTAVKRSLKIGRQSGLDYEILSGIEEGDILISNGAQNVVNGEKVRIIEKEEEK